MNDIILVKNTKDIPTAHQETYVLINATNDRDFQDILADFISETGKVIGNVYRLGDSVYYAEVTA